MHGAEPRLWRLQSPAELAPAEMLAREYAEWALERAGTEYGVVPTGERMRRQVSGGLEELLEGRGRLYLAEVRGMPAGLVGLKPLPDGVGEVKHLYVRPDFRGLGIARSLLHEVVSEAEALGYRRLRLETTTFMREAQMLYRSIGFVETSAYEGGEFGDIAGAAEILTFMELELGGD
jgi:ribosomal protein S18 acetylase RimI-like enzyme